jgi:phosphoribosyl-ATP pyrophosphohydrolase
MNKFMFLLDKLAEEAAEVAQAALKHKHKQTKKSRSRLSAEVGDLLALVALVRNDGITDLEVVSNTMDFRVSRTKRQVKELSR